MIRHIVMFKLKEFPDEILKAKAAQEVKLRIDELPKQISSIKNYHCGVDIRRLEWSYDIVLQMDFDSLADLDAYTVHPFHQEFIVFNKNYTISKVCTDYEFQNISTAGN